MRRGRLLRFQLNSTSTSEVQMAVHRSFGKDVWHDSESTATKICCQIGCKLDATSENHSETCIDWTELGRASIFDLKLFEQSATQNNHQLWYWLTSHFSKSNLLLDEQKLCEEKRFQLQSMSIAMICTNKGLRSRILVWPWFSTRAILRSQPCTQKTGWKLRDMTSHTPCFSEYQYELMA